MGLKRDRFAACTSILGVAPTGRASNFGSKSGVFDGLAVEAQTRRSGERRSDRAARAPSPYELALMRLKRWGIWETE